MIPLVNVSPEVVHAWSRCWRAKCTGKTLSVSRNLDTPPPQPPGPHYVNPSQQGAIGLPAARRGPVLANKEGRKFHHFGSRAASLISGTTAERELRCAGDGQAPHRLCVLHLLTRCLKCFDFVTNI